MLDAFFGKLAEIKSDFVWQLDSAGRIRTATRMFCPLTATCSAKTGERFDVKDYLLAAQCLGLDVATANDLVVAIDNSLGWRDQENIIALRNRFLNLLNPSAAPQTVSK